MPLIGRHKQPCISCGFAAPHIKRNEGKLAYVHCPECGLVCHSKNQQQARGLMANMRPETGQLPEPPATDQPIVVKADAPPAPKSATAAPTTPAPAAPPAKRAGFFDTLLTATK
jgi:hypothetical protein